MHPGLTRKRAASKPNRLAHETSPYLLQHAHNPVDWYPWGEEAFAAARQADRLIFLSVGYSTCYWCHVMERECFEDETIAALMNEHFINIKVDREERPDVDDLYMTAVQLMTRQGGWPMSVWLEPRSLRPVVGGTYFPPTDQMGRPGFPAVITQIAQAWTNQRQAVEKQAASIAEAVAQVVSHAPPPRSLDASCVESAVDQLMQSHDPTWGGFGRAPKFPTPINLDLLMAVAWHRDDVRRALLHTLDRMACGGIFDQVGGGFHRYSVDTQWLVPHFEKMLYDNGQLLSTYARAHELTGDDFYARILRRTIDYVQREMTDTSGGFFSAQDAEVDAREGLNYLWIADEVRSALNAAGRGGEVDLALDLYGLRRGPNFRDPHHPGDPPRNVLHLADRPDRLAATLGRSEAELLERLDRINEALLNERSQRKQPGIDDKVLTAWNGIMIAGLADAGRVLDDSGPIELAERAATFILTHLCPPDVGLLRSWRQGEARIPAFLEDYAHLARGLLALHRATDDGKYLERAVELLAKANRHFHDPSTGTWFDSPPGQTDLFVRVRSQYDGAVPSGNATMMLTLLDAYEVTGDRMHIDRAIEALRAISAMMRERPIGLVGSVLALDRILKIAPNAFSALTDSAPAPDQAVKVSIVPDHIDFDAQHRATVRIEFEIAEGCHINAREPGISGLVPLQIDVSGNDIEAEVAYPEGEPAAPGHAGEPVLIHRGRVAVPIELTRRSNSTDAIKFLITYQACTDAACLAPRTEVLTVNVQASP